MKKLLAFSLIISLIIGQTIIIKAESSTPYWTETKQISYSGGSVNLNIFWTDLNNKRIAIETGISPAGVGTVDDLANIIASQTNSDGQAIGGINGSYFNAYGDLQVSANLIEDGNVRHIMNTGSAIGFDENNQVVIGSPSLGIVGGINGRWEWPYKWYATSLNHFTTSNDAVMIFDHEFGGYIPDHDFMAVVVQDNIITSMEKGGKTIPSEGFLILSKQTDVLSLFQLGDKLEYDFTYQDSAMNPIKGFENLKTLVGAGPTLVKDGVIVVDPISEGFTSPKMTKESHTRSLIGVTADNMLAMFVIPSVTLSQAAEIAYNLGLIQALNLDGGASSGLYYKDSYINTPGRQVSNAVLVRYLKKSPINIQLNGRQLYFDSLPFLDTSYNRTLVPLRKIAESLNATVSWDKASQSILIKRYQTELSLQLGSKIIYVNGVANEMDIPVTLRNDRSYVPVRFITEYFKGSVDWDGATSTVILTIDTSDSLLAQAKASYNKGDFQEAIVTYKKAFELDPSRDDYLRTIADIYRLNLKDNENSIIYYEKVLDIDPNDADALKGYGTALFNLIEYDKAIGVFEHYINLAPDQYNGYYFLASIYHNWRFEDLEKAKYYYEKTLETNPPDWVTDYIHSLPLMN